MNLKNKSCPLNCLPARVVKYVKYLIAPVLSALINRSVASGSFPSSLKIARVVPIFKGGSSSDVGNYRPISVLPVFSKIFEKAMYLRVYQYLSNKGVLSEKQFGFRNGRGTINANIELFRYLYKELDADRYVLSIFIDFRKAFDCVCHEILLGKLWHYGIRGECHEWFKSYLSNRRQFVSLSGVTSTEESIICGVPQGSILGPLLFLLFINDVTRCTDEFQYALYADDCTLSYAFSKVDACSVADDVNYALRNVLSWVNLNKLAINVNKTGYLVFSYRGDVEVGDVVVEGFKLNRLDIAKFLGINIDSHLTLKHHFDHISSKISKGIGILYKLRGTIPLSALRSIYFALVHPHLVYGIEVYFNAANVYRDRLFLLQKRAIRAINNLSYDDHTNDYFYRNKILKLHDLHRYQICLYTFKTINCGFDVSFLRSIIHHSDTHQYSTRNSNNFILPLFRKSKSQHSLDYVGVRFWNDLCPDIKRHTSLNRFKFSLKNYLLSKYI